MFLNITFFFCIFHFLISIFFLFFLLIPLCLTQFLNDQIDETVDPDKQKFLEVKAEKDEAKDVAVDGEEKEDENDVMEEEEDDLNIGHESLNNLEKEET